MNRKKSTYPMYPVLAFEVFDATVQRAWRQDQDEMLSLPDAVQQVVIKFTCFQSLHVNEYSKSSQLQVNLYQLFII